jgi:gamma-glutamyltranspeptidase/glutathione hydrolase
MRARRKLALLALGSVLAGAAEVSAANPEWGRQGMVVSSVGPAAAAGREILIEGGNAIDAAVAAGFAAGVSHQFSSGLGGGGFILAYLGATGEVLALDAREVAPAAAGADMFLDAAGQVDPQASRLGGRAVAVPGLLQGLHELHTLHGRLPWARVVEPARRLCREGVPVGVHHRRMLALAQPHLSRFPETARIQLADGQLPPLGWKLVQPDLERTLEAIAQRGPQVLQRGEIAEAMVKATRAHGGVLTLDDLASYRTRRRTAVRGYYRGLEILSMPPPSSGGIHLIQMLNTLEPFDLAASGMNSSETIHLMAEAMKLAFADRAVHLGDPDFYPVPLAWLTSKSYGLELAQRLEPRPFWRKPPWLWGRSRVLRLERSGTPPPDDGGTTHISVLDAAGNAVALTQTVNTLFGSGITAPGTGIVLNNEMDDFAAAPNAPIAFGLVGQRANAIAPGKRPLSSMTPTIVLRDGRPWLVAGSPMGPMIITTVLQTLINVIDFGMNIQDAVAAPRFHHQWRPDRLLLEPEHPRDVVARLEDWGHPVRVSEFHFGASVAILRDPETGLLWGGVDPRRDSAAAGF